MLCKCGASLNGVTVIDGGVKCKAALLSAYMESTRRYISPCYGMDVAKTRRTCAETRHVYFGSDCIQITSTEPQRAMTCRAPLWTTQPNLNILHQTSQMNHIHQKTNCHYALRSLRGKGRLRCRCGSLRRNLGLCRK